MSAVRRDEGTAGEAKATVSKYATEISDLLVSIYNSVEEIETKMLSRTHGFGVSMSDARVIEAVGKRTLHTDKTISVSEVASECHVQVPSATASVNRLVGKGFLRKERSSGDARRVNVLLTSDGERIYRLHTLFHVRMAAFMSDGMSAEEQEILLKGIRRIAEFYAAAEGE